MVSLRTTRFSRERNYETEWFLSGFEAFGIVSRTQLILVPACAPLGEESVAFASAAEICSTGYARS